MPGINNCHYVYDKHLNIINFHWSPVNNVTKSIDFYGSVTSHQYHITSKLPVFSQKLFRLTIYKISKLHITDNLWGDPPVTRAFDKFIRMWKMTPCHAFTICSSSCDHNIDDKSAMAIVIVWCQLGNKTAYLIIRQQKKRQYCEVISHLSI